MIYSEAIALRGNTLGQANIKNPRSLADKFEKVGEKLEKVADKIKSKFSKLGKKN